MPVTAATFIVGWLAIAGVPPFAGFWSKDEILLFAWADNKALWAIGLVTALLTAYYMSRQVFLVFYGEPRFDEEGEHAVHPHESPWTMTTPLVLLAGLAIVGGGLNLPFTDATKRLEHWLHPVLEYVAADGSLVATEAHIDVATGVKVALAVVAVVAGLIGIAYAAQVFLRRRAEAIEPEVLAHGWYYDETISAVADGPGRAAFEGLAAFDANVVDGAVNGTGGLARLVGSKLRVVQSGYVRTYALGLAVGAIVLIGFVLGRAGT
jgi:NADH-quinone oxidoreductase subunit L